MTTPREAFLDRVRQAVRAGNRPGSAAAVEARGAVGYQGAGPDPVARFRDEFIAAGGLPHIVSDRQAAVATVLELVQSKSPRRVLIGRGEFLDSLNLAERLRLTGIEVVQVADLGPDNRREAFFAADLGISGVKYLVAETGTIAVTAGPEEPRSLTLLPPVHVAVAERAQILPDLFDLFATFEPGGGQAPVLPSCLTLITGPSKTGDIELRLVTGVHGPGEVHVVLVAG